MLVRWPSPFLFWTEVENHKEIKKLRSKKHMLIKK